MSGEEAVTKALEQAPAAAAAWAIGKPLVEKLLGPTVEYLGKGGQELVQKGAENLGRVFKKAVEKSGDRLDEPGQVPPKVLKAIIDDAPYNDNLLAADYYGGVLASSRTGISRDDRGAAFSKIIGNLSSYQLRAHYVFYSTFFYLLKGQNINLGMEGERKRRKVFIPLGTFYQCMDFSAGENFSAILPHIVTGLVSNGLGGDEYAYGTPENIKSNFASVNVEQPGILFTTSPLGHELFLWAQGRGDIPINGALMSFDPIFEASIPIPRDAKIVG